MKRILGLDLGTTSIGWALVNEAENENEVSSIVKLGVRLNPLSTDELTDFEKGNPMSVNADRTLKRGARRNLQRYKLRRDSLIRTLKDSGFINEGSSLTEEGKNTTFETLRLRAKAANEKVSKEEFARILLTINKKRGYKSSRKAKNEEEGTLIDGMSIAKEMYDNNLTPGQFVLEILNKGKKYIPDFYRSDLRDEFDRIWNFQKKYYPEILTDEFYDKLEGQGQQNSRKMFLAIHQVYTAENRGKREEVKLQHYQWRADALSEKLPIDVVAYVLVEINNNLNQSSGYLGAISDRSKELYFNKETVGENLYRQIQNNPHTRLKSQVFYRQDYLDEFEKIWETQAIHYPELTKELKEEIRDYIIFYQRKLKSQKHLISHCELEPYHKVIPKSSPLFQEYKIWQVLNNIAARKIGSNEIYELDQETKEFLFEQLNQKGKQSPDQILKFLNLSKKEWKLNYANSIEGNSTNAKFLEVFRKIAENEGYGFDWDKKSAHQILDELIFVFESCGIDPDILHFNSDLEGNSFAKQKSYQFWHLLYSAEDDDKIDPKDALIYGNTAVNLKKKLHKDFGFSPEYAAMVAGISFSNDYGNLSARAIRKILPFMKEGHEYSEACKLAGYNHSHSLTAEEAEKRELKDHLELLKKNSLRNPIVEKILNQMVNLINQVIDTYGKPDEVRVELARELKKNAEERKQLTQHINQANKKHEEIKKKLQLEFGIPNPSRNDLIRYKLYEELRENGYKTIYSNRYISRDKLFSKEIDIEHIIPKARLFDDSFSNKTLEFRSINLDKGEETAMDYMNRAFASDVEAYKQRVDMLQKAWLSSKGDNGISKGKAKKLLMELKDIPEDFIERDLRNSQYIARKAKQMLFEVFRTVNTTSGSITDKLRADWDLINVMKELNLPKYRALGLTEMKEKKDGRLVEDIIDWTKRNDHRHHAMDALTVAFTTYSHVQYLNNLNAAKNEESKLYGIKQKITKVIHSNDGNSRVFIPPMDNFREEAKRHLESVLISIKAKNKVVTKNVNKIKRGEGELKKVQLTPRGQLHKETVYGRMSKEVIKELKVGTKMTVEMAQCVTKPKYKEALLARLEANGNDPKKAFAGKNAPGKKPVLLIHNSDDSVPDSVKVKYYEDFYTIRKDISPDLKIEKIVDEGIKRVLEERIAEFDGDKKTALSDLEKNPIWLNKEKGISIKSVTIHGVNNAEALHDMKDHNGNLILDKDGKPQGVDFVSTGNNHHIAIFRDEKGKLQEQAVSFYEALARVNNGYAIIEKDFKKNEGWEFLFTMKQNEYFVFPDEGFDPNEIDLLNPDNYSFISPHLFRVQKIATKNYFFRHHLETTVDVKKELSGIAYKSQLGLNAIDGIIKVRVDHMGQIVGIGEY